MNRDPSNPSPFSDLGLRPATLAAVRALGFERPTPIQERAIPLLLQGEDLIGQAQTGTGKTAAFGLPLIEAVSGRGIQALVLCPTRELAIQVADDLNELGNGSDFKAVAVYGGVGFGGQTAALKNRSTTCIVATPGRLLDHLERRTVTLDGVSFLVLDEADRMLDMGFLPDVERILRRVPARRQTSLFSATMPDAIKTLAGKHLRTPEFVRVGEDSLATPLAALFRVPSTKDRKLGHLLTLLDSERAERTMVFVRTRHGARRLLRRIVREGIRAVALHGDMGQGARDRALDEFREGKASVLVATDVASRGLDVPEVTHVVNFDAPAEPEAFVHRVGRTGRAGKRGRAFLFATPDDGDAVRDIERLLKERIPVLEVRIPEALERRLSEAAAKAAANRPPGVGSPRGGGPRSRHPRGRSFERPGMRAPARGGPGRRR